MNKKINNYEVDLSEIILKIINNKLRIVLIILITVVSSLTIYFMKNTSGIKVILSAETEVVSNSIFNDYQYQALNDFINIYEQQNLSSLLVEERKEKNTSNQVEISVYDNYSLFDNFNFDFGPIDKSFLYELFVEKLNQKDFLIKAIIQSDLIDKKKFNNNDDYEKEVLKLASAIKIIHETENKKINSVKIKFKTSDKNKWENFLYSIEKSANNEIQDYLKTKFDILILNMNRKIEYLLEDIEFDISANIDNKLISHQLNLIKKKILTNKNTERLINLYKETPIFKSNNFSAAKINLESTKYQDITDYPTSIKKVTFTSILLGVFLGIIYVLIATSIVQNRK
jgi:hypothetical protein